MLSNCYEKFNSSQSQAPNRKKKQNVEENSKKISGKEKLSLINDVLKDLKNLLHVAENSLGEIKFLKFILKILKIIFNR